MRCPVVLVAVVMAVVGTAVADDPLVTDRPTVTASAVTVPRDTLQLEGGATWVDDAGGEEVQSVGEVLARWGVHDVFELRFGLGSWVRVDDGMRDRSGVDNSVVGVKVELADGQRRSLLGGSAAIIVETSIPTGSSSVAIDSWEPAAILAAGWSLTDAMSLGANLGYARLDDDGGRFGSVWVSAALALALGDRLAGFVEVYAYEYEEPRGPDVQVMELGVTYQLEPQLQLDTRIGRRMGSAGPDVVIGAGVGWRIGG
jgi:hypothetical protein